MRAIAGVACLLACAGGLGSAEARAAAGNGQLVAVTQVGGQDALVTFNPDGSGIRTLATFGSADISSPAWSPDGNRIAFVLNKVEHSKRVYVYELATGQSRRVTDAPATNSGNPIDDLMPSWSPDGARLAFVRVNFVSSVRTVRADGSDERTVVAEDSNGRQPLWPAWSPVTDRIAYLVDWQPPYDVETDGSLRTIDPNGTGSATVFRDATGWKSDPQWSPDGTRIVYAEEAPDRNSRHLRVVDVATGVRSDLTPPVDGIYQHAPDWSPDGSAVVYASSDDWPQRWLGVGAADGSSSRIIPLRRDLVLSDPDWQPCIAGVTVSCTSVTPVPQPPLGPPVTAPTTNDRGAASDRDAPTVTWLSRPRVDRLGRVKVRVRCSEQCVLSLRLSTKLRSRKTVAGPTKTVTAAAARTTTITLAIRRRGQKLSLAQVRSVVAVGSVTDPAGNRRNLRRAVRPKR